MSGVPTNPQRIGHEPDRVPVWAILATVAGLVLVIGIVAVITKSAMPSTHPSMPDGTPLPPFQARRDWGNAGVQQLQQLRAREEFNLTAYQWLDDKHTGVRIPIERAMQLLAAPQDGGSP